MKPLEGKKYITHSLQPFYDQIKSFERKKEFINSSLYLENKNEFIKATDDLEWDNTVSKKPAKKDTLRIVSWNIERGKHLKSITSFFKENTELSEADIILIIECDNGMGRTGNKNVAKELAESLNMNYCFSPSYLVLGKGALGETDHSAENTLALHGTAILSKYPIQLAKGVSVPPVKEVFHSSEKRLGCKKGLVVQIKIGNTSLSLGAIHIDLSSTAKDRANQLKAILDNLPEARIQIVGGDWNCSTFNLRRKWEILTQSLTKLCTIGFTNAVNYYMTPEKKFDKPLFDELIDKGFDFNSYNDRTKGTIYFDLNDVLTNDKAKKFIPSFLLKALERRLRPWGGSVPLKIDWLAGKGALGANAQTIERPDVNGVLLSDHNPIFVDLSLS